MKRLILLCLLLAGCAQRMELQTEPIALLYSAEEASKTDALSEGDEVTVCAAVDGAGNYFLENSRWTVGPDGKALVPPQPVFYPDAKQAVAFWAYFGSQNVPNDQSLPADLKKADLCWASASSTPTTAPVPLAFRHVFARLAVTYSQPTAKITAINAFSGGSLDIRSGMFANSTKSDVFTTQNELILPAQTLNRLILTSDGVEYVFDGSIALEAGQTTTVNLTLNPSTQTATLNGSSVSAWAAQTGGGTLNQAVSNVLTLHWPNFIQQGALPDKVLLTINGSDYTVSNGITYANQTFTVPFASSTLRYPYTVTKITFYSGSTQALPACTQLLGSTVYKSTAQTLGIKDQANAIKIGNIWWATGDLVATGMSGSVGLGGCRIGDPTDGGLYFQFGSLIGWKGGNSANGGNGVGKCNQTNGTYWNGLSYFSWTNEAYIWPQGMSGNPTSWPTQSSLQWYFGLQSGWSSAGQNIQTYSGFSSGALANVGVGDPCRYYLGSSWRIPTVTECGLLTGLTSYAPYYAWGTSGLTAKYVYDTDTFDGVSMKGGWFGPGINQSSAPSKKTALFFNIYSGYRNLTTGVFNNIGLGRFLSPTTNVVNGTENYQPYYNWTDGIAPLGGYSRNRTYGFTVRCVADAL